MTVSPTVTLHTLDAGRVTLPEPSWCTGHDGQQPEYRADLNHTGPEHQLAFGDVPLWEAMLSQHPCGRGPRQTGLYVAQLGYARTLDPAGLDALAAALVEHAGALRHLARDLAVLLAAGGGAR